jgi:hypothetical protein
MTTINKFKGIIEIEKRFMNFEFKINNVEDIDNEF